MKVAIFIDGKNFYAGWRDEAKEVRIDFSKLSNWLVDKVNGGSLWGVHYYTGIEIGEEANTDSQRSLVRFLDMLSMQSGYYIKRFPRKIHTTKCIHCKKDIIYTQEKEVDTTMVADIVFAAATDCYDVVMLLSGDADYAPAIDVIKLLGKKTYVATWGESGLSGRIRSAAFDHINLLTGVDKFHKKEEDDLLIFMNELLKAQGIFKDENYVGLSFFVSKWKSSRLRLDSKLRKDLLNILLDSECVERYDAHDGRRAIKLTNKGISQIKSKEK